MPPGRSDRDTRAVDLPAYTTEPLGGRPPLRRGKVRDLWDWGDALLLVASDRISAFDVVLGEPVPGKGVVLSALTEFWLGRTREIVPNHRITTRPAEIPGLTPAERTRLQGRAMLCRKARPYPVEFVVRGWLSGSGWKDYRESGSICGIALPSGLKESDRLPEPILTPTTKEEAGHDRPIPFAEVERLLGRDTARAVRTLALDVYRFAVELAASRGILLADTKFEFGEVDGAITLIDEVLTPDSSRFWPAESWKPGGPQPSFDKQFVRDWLTSTGWGKTPPAPSLPADVIARTAEKYAEICRRLTGESPEAYHERCGAPATSR